MSESAVPYVRPDWLPPYPVRAFGYGPQQGGAWYPLQMELDKGLVRPYGDMPYADTPGIHTAHLRALDGDAEALEAMRRFFLNLATLRLIR